MSSDAQADAAEVQQPPEEAGRRDFQRAKSLTGILISSTSRIFFYGTGRVDADVGSLDKARLDKEHA